MLGRIGISALRVGARDGGEQRGLMSHVDFKKGLICPLVKYK